MFGYWGLKGRFVMKLFQELGLDYDMLEEDQMMRAIAMSLGQDMPPAAAPAVDQVQIQYNLYAVPSLQRAFSIFSLSGGEEGWFGGKFQSSPKVNKKETTVFDHPALKNSFIVCMKYLAYAVFHPK